MKSDANKTGLTLLEMLIVVAIVVILTTMIIGLAGRVTDQSREQLTRNTIGILTSALGQFRDYEYRYIDNPVYSPAQRQFYLGLDFPLDCSAFDVPTLQTTLENALGLVAGSVLINPPGAHIDPDYSAGEVLYFFLSRVPECRKTLDKIDGSLITSEGYNNQLMTVTIGGKVYPLLRIIDPWGTTLRYKYYDNMILDPHSKLTFPVIISAGQDKQFGNTDDISSRK